MVQHLEQLIRFVDALAASEDPTADLPALPKDHALAGLITALRGLDLRLRERAQGPRDDIRRYTHALVHELRAPIRHLDFYSELLEDEPEATPEERARHIAKLRTTVETLRGTLKRIVGYADACGTPLKVSNIETMVLVQELCASRLQDIEAAKAQISISPLPNVVGDRQLVTQVYAELLDNALRFRGEQPLHIEFGVVDEEDGPVYFVRDNGRGLEDALEQEIVKLFVCADREDSGHGLGLAVAARAVERHGGRLWCARNAEAGLCVKFSLGPVAASKAA